MQATYTEQQWLQTPPGAYLLAQEQVLYDHTVPDLFGFNAMQLGMPEVDFLRNSRIPYRFHAAAAGAVKLRCSAIQLPLASQSIDLLLLPHVLEFSTNPHDTLREAERILVPEGCLVLSGFNPLSLWGVRHLLCHGKGYPWEGHFISLSRLKDWLTLLGLEVVGGRMACYAPPWHNQLWLKRCYWLDRAGNRWWPLAGGVYFLVAKKRVAGLRVIRPSWNHLRALRALMPKPTQKTMMQKCNMDNHVEIYVDGACKGNPGPGGWGVWLRYGKRDKELFGGEPLTTNNRMELTAVIRALEALKRGCRVRLHTDSQYVHKGISEWIAAWKARGWRTAGKQPVKNDDLWKRLDELTQQHDIEWVWVRGHTGNAGNERADMLANRGVAQLGKQSKT